MQKNGIEYYSKNWASNKTIVSFISIERSQISFPALNYTIEQSDRLLSQLAIIPTIFLICPFGFFLPILQQVP